MRKNQSRNQSVKGDKCTPLSTIDNGQKALRYGSCAAGLLISVLTATTGKADFEVGLFTGIQSAHSNEVVGNDPTGVGPFRFEANWEGDSAKSPPYYGARATWWRNDSWGAHLDFTHSKAYASDGTLAETGFTTLEFTDGLNNLTIGASRRWLNQWEKFTPYIGAGVGVALPRVEVQTTDDAVRTNRYQLAGPNVALMTGVNYALSSRWSLFGEFKATHSWIDVDLDDGGALSTEIWTSALNIGASVEF